MCIPILGRTEADNHKAEMLEGKTKWSEFNRSTRSVKLTPPRTIVVSNTDRSAPKTMWIRHFTGFSSTKDFSGIETFENTEITTTDPVWCQSYRQLTLCSVTFFNAEHCLQEASGFIERLNRWKKKKEIMLIIWIVILMKGATFCFWNTHTKSIEDISILSTEQTIQRWMRI